MADRVEILKRFIQEDPSDVFSRYALALEYLKSNPASALSQLQVLLDLHPEYLPSYYPAAHLLIDSGRPEEAESLFQKGIEVAARQGEKKIEMELKAAYSVWNLERT